MDLTERPRRNRRTPAIRAMARETRLDAGQLIYPLFVHDDAADVPLESLPGQTRWSLEGLVAEAGRALALGVDKVVVFPKIDDALKSRKGKEATNDAGLVPRAVRARSTTTRACGGWRCRRCATPRPGPTWYCPAT